MAHVDSFSFPFLRLPLEIRLMIYEELLLPTSKPCYSHSTSVANLIPTHSTYYSSDTNISPFDLSVRTIDPYLGVHAGRSWRRRSTYYVRTGPFLTSTTPTTYRILLSPYTAHLRQAVPSLMRLNRQIHNEAAKVLYSNYRFCFGTNVEAAVRFFGDLTPAARGSVRHVQLTKMALPHTKEFDRYEWSHLCAYFSSQLRLQTLDLGVIAGLQAPPSTNASPEINDGIKSITKEGFEMLSCVQKECKPKIEGVDLEWAEELMQIKGLRDIRVCAVVEHCAVPRSEGVKFWVAFSRSVEVGFAEWVRDSMIGRA